MGSKSITTREDGLFAQWKLDYNKSYKGFITDGVFNETAYLESPVKILFILKEAVDEKPACWDLRRAVEDGSVGPTWSNITRWTNAIHLSKTKERKLAWSDFSQADKIQRKEALQKIVAVNLKKSPGRSVSDMKEISNEAHPEISAQIALYNPDLVVCCGNTVANIVSQRIFKNPKTDTHWQSTDRDVWYFDGQKADAFNKFTPIISFHHPQNRISSALMAFSLLDAWNFIQDKLICKLRAISYPASEISTIQHLIINEMQALRALHCPRFPAMIALI